MRTFWVILVGSLASAVFVACQHTDQKPSATTNPAVVPPAPEPVGSAATAAEPSANRSATASVSSGYPMCSGQRVAGASAVARSGPVNLQLSPAFLDQMPACRASEAFPKEKALAATKGAINAKGDCELASVGVTCHYHSGSEFLNSTTSKQTPGQGELHCIFPSDDPKSPRVYGAHIVCRDKSQGEAHGHHGSHEVHQGAACAPSLVQQLGQCQNFRCCDDGTLTNPISDLARDGRNDVRPDFRICDGTIEVDCADLSTLTAHDANSPARWCRRAGVCHRHLQRRRNIISGTGDRPGGSPALIRDEHGLRSRRRPDRDRYDQELRVVLMRARGTPRDNLRPPRVPAWADAPATACPPDATGVTLTTEARSQSLEPRASPAPIGMNFAGLGAIYTGGGYHRPRCPSTMSPPMLHPRCLLRATFDLFGRLASVGLAAVCVGDGQRRGREIIRTVHRSDFRPSTFSWR